MRFKATYYYENLKPFSKPSFLLFLFILCTKFTIPILAQESITFSSEPFYKFTSFEILTDSLNSLTIIDVSAGKAKKKFININDIKATTKKDFCAYWIKFKINIHPSQPALVLNCPPYFSTVEVYILDSLGNYTLEKGGMQIPTKERKMQDENPSFIFPNKGYEQTCYVKLTSKLPDLGISINFSKLDSFHSQTIATQYDYGIFFGIIVIISIYSFILFFKIGERAYLYYGLYVISFGLFACSAWGMMFKYIPDANFGQVAFINMYTLPYAFMSIWLLCYTQSLLDTRIHTPIIHQTINLLIVFRIFLLLIGLLYPLPGITNPLIESGLMLFAFWAGIKRWNQGYKQARYFLIAMFVLLIGVLIHSTQPLLIKWPIPNYINQYGLYIAGVAEIILFSIALADRFKNLKLKSEIALKNQIFQMEENEKLKDKINRELEEKVVLRTSDFNIANIKLQQQAKEIERINVLLQSDNLKLYDNVKKISQDRVTNKKVSFDEFKLIYSDDDSCYKYLEEIKWKNGFQCIKCSNTKYSSGPTPYSRRCSKCNNIERIYSGTVFSGVRFPIQKAFCFIFLIYHEKGITIDQLATKLELGRQTVWAFRKKGMNNITPQTTDWSAAIIQKSSVLDR